LVHAAISLFHFGSKYLIGGERRKRRDQALGGP
jgi:hypothetical protein